MKEKTREEPAILAAAERKMQAWVRTQETADRTSQSKDPQVGAYVAISRESGAGGSQIAQSIGQRLGWQVLDRNLVDRVAERFHESRTMLEQVDEAGGNWIYDVLAPFIDGQLSTP